MKITVELVPDQAGGNPAQVEIYFDREGLEYLMKYLSKLKKAGDHCHFMTEAWGMYDLSEDIQKEGNSLVHHLRVTLIEEP
ncbi:Imm32 family immunity protein [Oligoflexus tunisiensis]|uniref:Imm32 family immunity protein n=1 Tax=Oligoflexus tunisiensis TaxID=708132 RepID=UPI00114C9876|nr:Imm32 family immunity protein [Oligoflexus tunisiensis]